MLLSMGVSAFANSVTIETFSATAEGEIAVSGKVSGDAQVESTILVTDGTEIANINDENIVYIDQVTTDANGAFNYNFKVDTAKDGADGFMLYLGGTNVAQVTDKQFTLSDVEPTGYTIEGSVGLIAYSEAAVEGLSIVVSKGETSVDATWEVVDNQVKFSAEVAEAGTYTITVTKQGYLKDIVTVEVVAEDVVLEESVVLRAGDVIGYGIINLADLQQILNRYEIIESDEAYDSNFDINKDGQINLVELQQVLNNYEEVAADYSAE